MIVLPAALRWGCASAALLLAEHLLLYERISRIEAYSLGTATIGMALSGYAATTPQQSGPDVAAAFWPIALVSGATVAACYAVREALEHRDAIAYRAGQLARSLSSEEKPRATHEPIPSHRLPRGGAGADARGSALRRPGA